ncbi:hypothetical protein F5144DRAFT_585765 [Chaetomium tenue]|uniref:Uncharacterized protein n=1 Tax=Chaetomium tenue TaxID=1854479 RepID=A0ACB7NWX2_9PEZI|nr:hypothetical protein F5144DRAFT_585765 [Chaetomium globosum]
MVNMPSKAVRGHPVPLFQQTQASMIHFWPSFSTNTRVAAGAGTTSRDGFVDFAEVMKVDTQVNNGKALTFPKRRE